MSLSKIKENITLDFLLNEKESIFFERKWVFSPDGKKNFTASKLADSIIWMLNANGWLIVLWINNGEIQDLKNLDNTRLNDFKQVVHDFILPSALVKMEEIYIDKNDIVTLVLENNVMKSKKTISKKIMGRIEKLFFTLNDTEKLILKFLLEKWEWTKLEIAKEIKVSEKTVRRYLKKFIDLGLVLNLSWKQRWNDIIYSINYKEN